MYSQQADTGHVDIATDSARVGLVIIFHLRVVFAKHQVTP